MNEEGEAQETGLGCGHQGRGPSSEKSQHQKASSFRHYGFRLALLVFDIPLSLQPQVLAIWGWHFLVSSVRVTRSLEIKSLKGNIHKIAYDCHANLFLKIKELVNIMKILVNVKKVGSVVC